MCNEISQECQFAVNYYNRGRYYKLEQLFQIDAEQPATLLKKRLWHRCFPVNFVKFLRKPFLTEQLRKLLLFFNAFFLMTTLTRWIIVTIIS